MRVIPNRAVASSTRPQTDTSAQKSSSSPRLHSANPRAAEATLARLDKRAKGPEGTPPEPLIDTSKYAYYEHVRPDGQPIRIERHGNFVIPHLLPPGGAELPPLILPGKSLNILALGDGGHGNESQRETAIALTKMARERGVNFSVHTGDMVYPHGISSVDDPQLKWKVTDAYGELPEMHAVPGNHDYGDKSGAGMPEALVEAAGSNAPGMFRMPTRYYSRLVKVDGLTIRTIFMDTSTLPVDPIQIKWLRAQLEKDADYTLVFGHHPVMNDGLHGVTPFMNEQIGPLLEARADLYVCGHEHNQQQLRTEGGMPTVVSGAASEGRPMWPWGNREFGSMRRGGAFFTVSRDGITYDALSSSQESVLFSNCFQRRDRAALPTKP